MEEQTRLGMTSLSLAAREGHIGVTKFLLESEARASDGDFRGDTALHHAAANGHVFIVDLLLEFGASVNVTNVEGKTAEDAAREADNENIVFLLQRN